MRAHGTRARLAARSSPSSRRFAGPSALPGPPVVPGKLEARPERPRASTPSSRPGSHAPRRAEVILKLRGVTDRIPPTPCAAHWCRCQNRKPGSCARRFYHHQILGLRCDDRGRRIGTVVEILETGANDVTSSRAAARRAADPAITQVVKWINPARGEILIELIPAVVAEFEFDVSS